MDRQNIPAAEIFDAISYQKESGQFYWNRTRGGNAPAGSVAGFVREDGYVEIMFKGKRFKAHRLAWLFTFGEFPAGELDHINGNGLDNRIANLREVTGTENKQSIFRPRSDNKAGLRGVHFDRGKYVAQIKHFGKSVHIGRFETAEQASAAYLLAKEELHPASRVAKPHFLAAANRTARGSD